MMIRPSSPSGLEPIPAPAQSGPNAAQSPAALQRLTGTSDQGSPHTSWIFTPSNPEKTGSKADKLSQAFLLPEPDVRTPGGGGSVLR
jgi:hypothetical protein